MRSIRDVAVFAWPVVGINGNLATFSRGSPGSGAQPPDGLPVWDTDPATGGYQAMERATMVDCQSIEARIWGSGAPHGRSPGLTNTVEFGQIIAGHRATVATQSPGDHDGSLMDCNCPAPQPSVRQPYRETASNTLHSRSCARRRMGRPPTPPDTFWGAESI